MWSQKMEGADSTLSKKLKSRQVPLHLFIPQHLRIIFTGSDYKTWGAWAAYYKSIFEPGEKHAHLYCKKRHHISGVYSFTSIYFRYKCMKDFSSTKPIKTSGHKYPPLWLKPPNKSYTTKHWWSNCVRTLDHRKSWHTLQINTWCISDKLHKHGKEEGTQ